ncbi:MAG: Gfo/Idh/MocA family oxidoreductase [Mesorhizobium sp.]|uniref:Gfo/Idh/MocA family protein n=1 Tax=unclassified Mesorhizobium TaxID=325217 RepID=UPI000F751CDF|nr:MULTISPECIES: Gfo/Idh/MocA family oxidoreductase [unclassified Mesorhizobium]AZO65900.1 Gfo/Idh/MocA family oxidoreductase [Mesorhizobium sp. M6A.T.Cr.TU.016.01.1.1]RWN36202.1 MAG: Gfo/Idh/MocA family oxidoreductase [Mesorhizobium sp.]RWP55627.1 MAG: Gfo/Idh/MocA family oxidoreductase [Mesorhizobium sp.]RWQ38560.1 MAG: Gfo/Idh/MocA family oxidoreductase [Mesorhizobium sp.]RWQ43639.1 MAG: Gfo/Idh/MocA family oxidoreductase [Mesorhizobium sp.]
MRGQSGAKLGIGVVGCGNISMTYLRNAALFGEVELRACADISPDMAALRASEYGIRAVSVDALLADLEIDLVLNLTIPAAHFDISFSALSAGKHVFTEKPLATSARDGRRLVTEATERGLLLGSAPDTFLGAAGRRARRLMDDGAIGRAVTGTAFMMGRGMEHWHPNPQFYYQPGGGPVFDMGPYYLTMLVNLLGPVARVMAMATRGQEERLITAEGPYRNTSFKVGTPTNVLSLLEFRSGATVTFGASWDVFRHSNHPIELHGTEGSLRLPDPDTFGGTVSLSERGADWADFPSDSELYGARNWPFAAPDRANYRMLGVADLSRALISGRRPRASGDLALHVLEIMEAILASGESRESVAVNATVDQPPLLQEDEAASLLA